MVNRLRAQDEGFTIVEALVALVIIFGLLLLLLRSFDTGVRVLIESKRQAAASALASELIERARSLEWKYVGLTASANGTSCPDDVGCASTLAEFPEITTAPYAFGGEPIVFATGATFDPFLQFHQQVTRDNTDFDRYLFVTSVRDDPTDPATERYRRITAVVRWIPQTGYRREIRLATYVSQFSEPSQPLIAGEVVFDGGNAQFEGWARGTDGWGISPSDETQATLTFPGGKINATTDYVSTAAVRIEGMSASTRGAGADGVFGTADDVVADTDAGRHEDLADDDATSAIPINDPPGLTVDLPRFDAVSGGGRIVEMGSGGALLSDSPANTSLLGEAWTKHDPVPGPPIDDGLPYASVQVDAAPIMLGGRVEYATEAVRNAYLLWTGAPLNEPAYEFDFIRHGNGDASPALEYRATADRYTDPSTERRKVTVDFTWAGEQIDLFSDSVYPAAVAQAHGFHGWVTIQLPTITDTDPVEAGEDAWPTPGITATSDLAIEFWNPSNHKYQSAFSGYNALGCSATPTVLTLDDGAGGPRTENFTAAGEPQLHYEVQGTLEVRGACVGTTSTYASGEIASNQVYASNIVTGTLHYRVVDTVADANTASGVLYDITLTFNTGGVQATAVYQNPELAP